MKWHILAQRKRAQACVEWHAPLQNFPEQQKCGRCASKILAESRILNRPVIQTAS